MQKFSDDFPNIDLQKAQKLAQSDTAKQLIAILQADHSDQLQNAMQQATSGNLAGAKEIMQQLMASEQAQQLLRQLQGE